MRLLPQRGKSDPAKTAFYNPKQFRRPSEDVGVEDRTPPQTFNPWVLVFLLCLIGGAAYYGWPRNSREMHPPIRPVAAEATLVDPKLGMQKSEVPARELPLNGQVKAMRKITSLRDRREIKIVGRSEGQHCAVRFEEWHGGAVVLSVFVRTSQSVAVALPAGSYRVKTACSGQWDSGQDAVRSIATWTAPLRLAHPSSSPATLNLNDI